MNEGDISHLTLHDKTGDGLGMGQLFFNVLSQCYLVRRLAGRFERLPSHNVKATEIYGVREAFRTQSMNQRIVVLLW